MGVKWEVPEEYDEAADQLKQFHEWGISMLEIHSKLEPAIWQKIDSLHFEVYGSLSIRFPITTTFSNPDSALIHNIQENAFVLLSQPSVTAIGLFEYGAIYEDDFFTALKSFAGELKKSGNDLYYTSTSPNDGNELLDFIIFEARITPGNIETLSLPDEQFIGGYLYSPSYSLKKYLGPFKKFLELTASSPQKPLILHSEWLLSVIEKNPQFSNTLQTLATESEVIFPLPRETTPLPHSSVLPVILLILVWGTIAGHYHMSPLYRKSLFRYFNAHKFFVNDVFQRQIRSSFPSLAIIFQNALLISACSFSTFSTIFTPLGQKAFFHYFPSLAFFGHNPFSIFLWTFVGAILFSFVSILWLYAAHKTINSFTQISTIYAWPLQLNYFFCTIAITLFSAGVSHQLIILFTATALLVLILSFVFASMDTFRFAKSRHLFPFKTSIPYLIAIMGLLIWILTNEKWMDTISLALHLK